MMARSFDRASPEQMEAGVPFDLDLYRWLLGHTRPDTLVLAADDKGAFTVMAAAGHRLVAAPICHADPYVAWPPRRASRSTRPRPGPSTRAAPSFSMSCSPRSAANDAWAACSPKRPEGRAGPAALPGSPATCAASP